MVAAVVVTVVADDAMSVVVVADDATSVDAAVTTIALAFEGSHLRLGRHGTNKGLNLTDIGRGLGQQEV